MTHNLRLNVNNSADNTPPVPGLFKVIVKNIAPTHPAFSDVTEEALWARHLDDTAFQIDNVPFFAKGISNGDVVRVRQGDRDMLYVDNVIARSGHSTYRVSVRPGLDDQEHRDYHELLSTLEYLGVAIEVATPTFFAVDVSPKVSAPAVYEVLELGLEHNIWDFDEGYFYPQPPSPGSAGPQSET